MKSILKIAIVAAVVYVIIAQLASRMPAVRAIAP
jgi:hypothetical protein